MNLNDMLTSDEYMAWEADRRSKRATYNPERFDRCVIASEQGADGSLHAEIMDDWTTFLEFHSVEIEITEKEYHEINIEILECWDWHDKNGSLYDEIG